MTVPPQHRHIGPRARLERFLRDPIAGVGAAAAGAAIAEIRLAALRFKIGIENIEQLWNPKQMVVEITGLKYQ